MKTAKILFLIALVPLMAVVAYHTFFTGQTVGEFVALGLDETSTFDLAIGSIVSILPLAAIYIWAFGDKSKPKSK